MITLRDYQRDAVAGIGNLYRAGKRAVLLRLPCRSGKTVVFSYVTARYAERNRPTLLMAHRRELISQIAQSLAAQGVPHRVIAAPEVVRQIQVAEFRRFGRSYVDQRCAGAIVGSVQTLAGKVEELATLGIALVVIDEAHHVVRGGLYARVIDALPGARLLMVTATPERLDGKGLGKDSGGYADALLEGPCEAWMIERGNISPFRIFGTTAQPDTAGIKRQMGDYDKAQLEDATDKPALIGDIVEHYTREASGMRTVLYAVSRKHSQHCADAFNAAGIPARHFDGDTPSGERAQIVADFADGKLLVLCNVALLGEGIDLAALAGKDVTIDCVIDAAPTQSLVKYIQQAMRCMAPRPGKTAVILDHAGNVHRHGFPDDPREWSLDGKRSRPSDCEPDVRMVCCGNMHYYRPQDARPIDDADPSSPRRKCPYCEWIAPVVERREIETKEGKLEELRREDFARRAARIEQGRAQTVEELMRTVPGMNRFRAQKIVQARREKAELMAQAMQCAAAAGVSQAAVRRMKPRELKALIQPTNGG